MKPEILKLPLPVIESTRHIALYVDDEACADGKPNNPGACALALTARKEIRGLQGVQIYRQVGYLVFKTHLERFVFHRSTEAAIKHFDKTGEFKPGLYQFCPPSPEKTLAGKRERARTHPTRTHPNPPHRRRPKTPREHFARPRGEGEFDVSIIPAPKVTKARKSK